MTTLGSFTDSGGFKRCVVGVQTVDGDGYVLHGATPITGTGAQTSVAGIRSATYAWNTDGTFGGATVKLQAKGSGGTWQDIAGATTTTPGTMWVALGGNAEVRLFISGGSVTALSSSLT